jgi:hypothetical protein
MAKQVIVPTRKLGEDEQEAELKAPFACRRDAP